jgi:integrase/recombinase XerD
MKYETDFIENLKENDKAKNTIDSYISDIKLFETFTCKGIEETDIKEIKNYISYLECEGINPKTINRKIASIRAYINYINSNHNTKINISKLKQLKICNQDFLKDSLTIEETRRIIKYAEKEKDIRAVLIVKLLLLTGGRVSEVLQIRMDKLTKNSITVKGKGGKYRQLLISKKLSKEIERYLEIRSNNSDFLLTGQRGEINRQTVHNTIKKYAGKARIKLTKAHAHAFRHLYTKILFDKQVPYSGIQQLLGHTLTVTELYGQLDKRELLKIINSIDI